MIKRFTGAILFVLTFVNVIPVVAADTDSLRVLWIGNSYTFYNDLPSVVRDIAAEQGLKMSMTRVLKGGERLSGHLKNWRLHKLLEDGGWDYVIVQEQSSAPADHTDSVKKKVYPYARIIDSLVMKNSPKAKVIFYMTWGHKYGNVRKTPYTLDDAYDTMQERLKTSYLEMAHDNNAWCAPVGMAWQTVRREHPEYRLYASDCYHPSIVGSYLAAHVIFSTIIQRRYQSSVQCSLPDEQAEVLQQTAQDTVLDNLRLLNITKK